MPSGIRNVSLIGCPSVADVIAGLPVEHVDELADPRTGIRVADSESSVSRFVLNVVGVDHVVVLADDVRATCAEISRVSGAELKRVKEGSRGVQGFHRLGSVIVEVVERRLVDPESTSGDGVSLRGASPCDATYWGFVLVVDDIDAASAYLGPDVVSAPKPAVQSNRVIATVRSGAGLGVPLALMSR